MIRTFTLRKRLRHALLSSAILLGVVSSERLQAQSTNPGNYCTPQHSCIGTAAICNYYNFMIERVQLNTLNHSAPTCPNNSRSSYSYWNNVQATQLSQGAVYTFQMKVGTNSWSANNGIGAWIDWNGDGVFSNDEFLMGNTAVTIGSGASYTRNITVPCNAKPGITRMRVRTDAYNGYYNYQACNNVYCYGESWDFDVNIIQSSQPTANFTLPDTVYTGSPARFTNVNQSGYIKHYWDVLNVGNSPDDSTTNFTYSFPNAGNYQLRLTSVNCQGQAIRTHNVTVVNPTSKPDADFVLSQNVLVYDNVTPLFVDFYDLSKYGATSWEWILTPDMGSGAPFFWTSPNGPVDQNTQVFFYGPMIYDVCLIATNSRGSDTACKPGYVRVTNPGSGATFVNWMGRNLGSTLDSGVIYDSGGPNGKYSNNEYTEFLIEPCGASEVTLTFSNFAVASGDVLYAYDGTNTTSPLLGTYTGASLPPTITAKSGKMFLVFLSNASGDDNGWEARWSSVVANNGLATADFFVPDTVFECSMGNEVLFRNTSTGLVPGQASFDWIFDYDGSVTYPTGYSDVAGEDEPLWQYFGTGVYNVRMVMLSCERNDTAVKSFVLAGTSGNPISDFTSSERILKVGATAVLEENTTAACSYEWEIFPNTYTIENGGSSSDRKITVKFTAPGSYNITLKATNDNGTTSRTKTNHIDVIQYCTPTVGIPSVADVGITQVTIESIDNQSTSGMGTGYSDYSAKSVEVIIGQTYNVTIQRGSNTNNIDRKVWVDYNRDGDFLDANELVLSDVNSNTLSYTGSFMVPAGVTLGEARMRVGVALTGTSLTSCGPASVGEYEDYSLILKRDDQAPVITLIGQDVIIEKNNSYTEQFATAFDNIEGNISNRIIITNDVDTAQAGIYFVSYNVSDYSGNKAVTVRRKVTVVEDMTAPVLSLLGNSTMLQSVLIPYNEPGFNAIDQPGNRNLNSFVQRSGSVDVNIIGDYVLTYTVNDDYGNTSIVTRTVQVRDTTKPVIDPTPTYNLQVGQPFVNPVTVTDNYDADVQLTILNGSVNTNAVGTYPVRFGARDASGNVAVNQNVVFNVADFIPPTIHYVPGTDRVIVKVFDNNWMTYPGMAVTTSDNFYGTARLEVIYPGNFSVDVLGTYDVTYRATDFAGNTIDFVRTVIVVDDVKPVVLTSPANVERWGSFDPFDGVNVKDNYYTPTDFLNKTNDCDIFIVRNNVDVNYPGLYQVIYVAKDGSGNTSEEMSRLVSVTEGKLNSVGADALENGVNVYPNPNNGQFTVEILNTLTQVSVRVTNSLGAVVKTISAEEMQNGKVSVDLSNVGAGVYFVQFTDGVNVATRRVVISK